MTSQKRPPDGDYVLDDEYAHEVNELFVTTYRSIERFEEEALRNHGKLDLSMNEAHVVKTVGDLTRHGSEGVTVSQIAATLDVRLPTATIAVRRLAEKGLFTKTRDDADGRKVLVALTREGRRAYKLHAVFHRRMVEQTVGSMQPEEREALIKGLRVLKGFFDEAAEKRSSKGAPNDTNHQHQEGDTCHSQ